MLAWSVVVGVGGCLYLGHHTFYTPPSSFSLLSNSIPIRLKNDDNCGPRNSQEEEVLAAAVCAGAREAALVFAVAA